MRMLLRPRTSTLLVLLMALIVGALSSQVRIMIHNRTAASNLAEVCGLAHEDGQTMFLSPFSPNSVREMLIDIDHNGRIEQRTVLVPMRNGFTCWYNVKDLDEDGLPDEALMKFDDRGAWLSLEDFDNDSRAEAWAVVLSSSADHKTCYTYNDLDMDGRLDRLTVRHEREVVESYIMLGDRWIPAAGSDGAKKVFIDNEAIEHGWFAFEGGKWVPMTEGESAATRDSPKGDGIARPDESDAFTEEDAPQSSTPQPNGQENYE